MLLAELLPASGAAASADIAAEEEEEQEEEEEEEAATADTELVPSGDEAGAEENPGPAAEPPRDGS